MNRLNGAVVLMSIALATNAWAQTDQGAAQPANNDEIVKMGMEI